MFRTAKLLAIFFIFAFASYADTHVPGSSPSITIANALPISSISTSSSAPNVYIVSNPDRSANAVLSWILTSGSTGVIGLRAYCTYNPSVQDYSNNTQYWIELAYQPVGSNLTAGVNSQFTVTTVPKIIEFGTPGCAQYAFAFYAVSGLATSVHNIILTFLPNQLPMSMNTGGSALLAYPATTSPSYANNGAPAIPNKNPTIIAALAPTNQYLPLTSDSSNNLNVDCATGCSGILGVFNDNQPQIFGASVNPGLSTVLAPAVSSLFAYGGTFGGSGGAGLKNWSAVRTPTVFKTCTATASGNTACWTPGSGNKFRLLGYSIEVSEDSTAAAGADLDVTLQDGGNPIGIVETCFVPNTASPTYVTAGCGSRGVNLGSFGVLSALANNVLNVNLSTTLTAGKVRVNLWGTEE